MQIWYGSRLSDRGPGLMALAIALAWGLGAQSAVAAGLGEFQDTRPGTAQALVLEVDRSVILRFNGMKRVAIVHPEVADVRVMSADELMVVAQAKPLHDQVHTMMYVWDRDGLHKFAVTVVGMRLAEKVAMELQRSLGPGLNVEVVSETMVVVEGQVPDDDAKKNLEALLEAASSEDVKVVGMVTTAEEDETAARRTAEALGEILDPRLKVAAFGADVIVVEGELDSREEVQLAREAISALGEGLRVVDMITVRGEGIGAEAPVAEIQRLLGEGFTVTALRGNVIAVDGIVASDAERERVDRLLGAYEGIQAINLVQIVPPKPDLDAAEQALRGALHEDIVVKRVGDEALLLEGSVPDEASLENVTRVLALFEGRVPVVNLVSVLAPDKRRVLVGVKVMEISGGASEDLGIDWGQYSLSAGGGAFRAQPFLMGQVPGLDGWRELYNFATQVHALVDRQKARILAEPNLLVNEDEEGSILIGGEIPVPIAQTGIGGAAAVTVEWKEFGVNLTIKPTISPDSAKVMLEVKPEVSSLDYGNAVTVAGLQIPAVRTRRAETIVTIPDGGVLAIGGLISSDQSKAVSKIPVLGDLPIIGQLFRHESFINNESELIILVLPQVLTEDGQPLHPIPVPEGLEEDVLQFGTRASGEIEVDEQ